MALKVRIMCLIIFKSSAKNDIYMNISCLDCLQLCTFEIFRKLHEKVDQFIFLTRSLLDGHFSIILKHF